MTGHQLNQDAAFRAFNRWWDESAEPDFKARVLTEAFGGQVVADDRGRLMLIKDDTYQGDLDKALTGATCELDPADL